MKLWMISIVTLLLGTAVGIGGTWIEFKQTEDHFQFESQVGPAAESDKVPRVEVSGGEEFDFGSMEYNTTRSHTFQIKNVGTAPLELTKGETTCKCTISDLKNDKLLPGETTEITLEWTPKDFSLNFRQSAEIKTNDSLNPNLRLVVTGQVTYVVRLNPSEFALGSFSSNEEKIGRLRIFGYQEKDVKIVKHELLHSESAKLYELKIAPLKKEEVDKEPGARSGLELTLHIKPGLPLGAIQQTIRLTTNVERARELDVPVRGKVASDISILGEGFDSENNVLEAGVVKTDQSRQINLFMLVKGPYRDKIRLTVGQIDPQNILKATIGEPKEISNGKAVLYPLTIEIPAGSRAVNRLGANQYKPGKIIIETTHPQAKQIQMFVRFSTEAP